MHFPLVVVVMSTYNGKAYIKEQIDSILSQDRVDVIIYIRDDGSTDGTPDIISDYEEKHPNVILEERWKFRVQKLYDCIRACS